MQTRLDTPDDIRHRAEQELVRSTQDRHHAWRTPVLATTGEDGSPNARVVVLRHANTPLTQLEFFTDHRSPKVAELLRQPEALLVFWSKRLQWQLRVRVSVAVLTHGARVDAVWQRLRHSPAAADYLSDQPPGAAFPDGSDRISKTAVATADPAAPVHHMALLCAQVREVDWLELSRAGHRRARWGANFWTWVTP